MNSTKIFLFVVLNCASLTLSAAALPNPLTDLPDAIFNRPRFAGGGGGGGGIYGGMLSADSPSSGTSFTWPTDRWVWRSTMLQIRQDLDRWGPTPLIQAHSLSAWLARTRR